MFWSRWSISLMACCIIALGACFAAPPPEERSGRQAAGLEVNGACFELIADSEWSIPPKESTQGLPVVLSLRVTNVSGASQRYSLFDTTYFMLKDARGRLLTRNGGRDGTRLGPTLSPPVSPGESFLLEYPADLMWVGDGSVLRLVGPDGFGGTWYFDGLSPGAYDLSIVYETGASTFAEDVWTGKVLREQVIRVRQAT